MSGSTSTDELDRVFRQVYQAVVDSTEMPGEAVPTAALTSRPARRPRGPLVALPVAGVVLAVGGLAFLTRDPYQFAGPVERLALIEVPPGLGGEPEVMLALPDGSIDIPPLPPLPPSEMWIWEAADGVASSVALFEVEIGADTGDLIGRTESGRSLISPDPGEVARDVLVEFGWHVASWTADDRWRIVVGFDEEEVGRLAQIIGENPPSSVDIEDRELAYEGPQIIRAPEGSETPSLFYDSSAGQFGVVLARGWPEMMTLARLSAPEFSPLEVNGMPAVSFGSNEMISEDGEGELGQIRTIAWQIDENTAGVVFGINMSDDLLVEIAERVRPVSVEDWEEIASTATGEGFG